MFLSATEMNLFMILSKTSLFLNMAGLLLNTIAAYFLMKSTFGFESPATYMDNDLVNQMADRNKKRAQGQRNGFILLLIGSVLQFVAILINLSPLFMINFFRSIF